MSPVTGVQLHIKAMDLCTWEHIKYVSTIQARYITTLTHHHHNL